MGSDARVTFLQMLKGDVAATIKRHIAAPTQSHRRDIVRTIFAAIEGVAWTYRTHVAESARLLGELKQVEELALADRIPIVSNEGQIIEQERFVPLLSSIRLANTIATRLNDSAAINFGEHHWAELRHALKIRHRITHPKSNDDLEVTDDEALRCASASNWLIERVSESMAATNQALEDHLADARNVLLELKERSSRKGTGHTPDDREA